MCHRNDLLSTMNFVRITRILSIGYGGLFGLARIIHEHFC